MIMVKEGGNWVVGCPSHCKFRSHRDTHCPGKQNKSPWWSPSHVPPGCGWASEQVSSAYVKEACAECQVVRAQEPDWGMARCGESPGEPGWLRRGQRRTESVQTAGRAETCPTSQHQGQVRGQSRQRCLYGRVLVYSFQRLLTLN